MSITTDGNPSRPLATHVQHEHVRTLRPERTRARPEDRELIASARIALALLDSKWTVDLVFLMASGIRRHARLYDNVPGISKKVLTANLRSLERQGLVERRVYADTPVRVEYSLSGLGWKLTELLMAVCDWVAEHEDDLAATKDEQHERQGAVLALPARTASSLAAA